MKNTNYSAWNPGISSEIPHDLRELETIYNPGNVFTSIDEVNELSRETGLNPVELVAFRPHRLVFHELIVRVTADIVFLEGENEEDLGINFREIANTIFNQYIIPNLMKIEHSYETMRGKIEEATLAELEQCLEDKSPAKATAKRSLLSRLFGKKPIASAPALTRQEREFEFINSFKQRGLNADNELSAAVFRSLYRVLGSIAATRGFIGNDARYLTKISSRHACNYLGSRSIGKKVELLVRQAIEREGYELLKDTSTPILISLKGASAAGKSSLRPTLRKMMADLGIEAQGFGTISPDIWRKMLLDYESLGDAHKYAGRFTSLEVNVIDTKLDHYIRGKAEVRNSIPHLMVDRFRFDSFASEKVTRVLHKTYVRYIDTMYMYFVVTPPAATVERGWERGLIRGRYKAVEDFLGHCIEAYAGMPKLLFKYLASEKPKFVYQFLDNSVAKGVYPELIARGTQGEMYIYRVDGIINIERFQRINVLAQSPEEVAPDQTQLSTEKNLGFLKQCIDKIKSIHFVDPGTEQDYLTVNSGKFEIVDQHLFDIKVKENEFHSIIAALAADLLPS
jgi:hypothetical protein